jgi:hypothetical protein
MAFSVARSDIPTFLSWLLRSDAMGHVEIGHSTNPGSQAKSGRAPANPRAHGTIRGHGHLLPTEVLMLQRTVGNQATVSLLGTTVQRVPISMGSSGETLYNEENTGGAAKPNTYGMSGNFEMTRNSDAGVTITVKVKYLSQSRNTIDPNSSGAPAGTPALGTLLGSPTEIPATDERRTWASGLAAKSMTHWNGHLTFVGEEINVFSENTKKRLPVTFRSEAVFGLADDAHSTVIVHPMSTTAGSPGQPIDAGNYYLNKGRYELDEAVIAAHEYGHLLGIADEYSQSNEQLNALIHQAAPAGAASARKALDRPSVEAMVLASMKTPLIDQLGLNLPSIAVAMRAKRAAVKVKMAQAAKEGALSPAVRAELTAQLTAASDAKLASGIAHAVAFQTTRNFSNRTVGGQGVEAGFSAAQLTQQIRDAYENALTAAQGTAVAVAGLGDVSISPASSISKMTTGTGAQSGAATGLAATTVGTPAGPGLPAIAPPTSLTAQLTALPLTWSAAGSTLESGVTPAAFASKMLANLKSAAAAAIVVPLSPGAAPAPKMTKAASMYARAYNLVQASSRDAAHQLATDLVATSIAPVLQASIASLQTSIATEVTRVMATPPSGVAALGTPDPNMVALVAAMKTTLEANQKATADGGRNPGTGAATQDVTYSYQGLMGSAKSTALRADQFGPMLEQFNSRLAKFAEKKFTAEVK